MSIADAELVLATLPVSGDLQTRLAGGGDGLELTGDDVDLLVDLATERLMTHGFDASYRPTEDGVALERLIDRLIQSDD